MSNFWISFHPGKHRCSQVLTRSCSQIFLISWCPTSSFRQRTDGRILVVYLRFCSVDSGVSPNYGSLPGRHSLSVAAWTILCLHAPLYRLLQSHFVASTQTSLIDEVSHTYMKNLSIDVDGL